MIKPNLLSPHPPKAAVTTRLMYPSTSQVLASTATNCEPVVFAVLSWKAATAKHPTVALTA